MTDTDYGQILKLNRSPLGKLALKHLDELGVVDEYGQLHPIQLVLELLENHPEKLPRLVARESQRLTDLLYLASDNPPLRQLELLLNKGELSVTQAANRLAQQMQGKSLEVIGHNLSENLLHNLAQDHPDLLGARQGLD
jgi:hypothetical protein